MIEKDNCKDQVTLHDYRVTKGHEAYVIAQLLKHPNSLYAVSTSDFETDIANRLFPHKMDPSIDIRKVIDRARSLLAPIPLERAFNSATRKFEYHLIIPPNLEGCYINYFPKNYKSLYSRLPIPKVESYQDRDTDISLTTSDSGDSIPVINDLRRSEALGKLDRYLTFVDSSMVFVNFPVKGEDLVEIISDLTGLHHNLVTYITNTAFSRGIIHPSFGDSNNLGSLEREALTALITLNYVYRKVLIGGGFLQDPLHPTPLERQLIGNPAININLSTATDFTKKLLRELNYTELSDQLRLTPATHFKVLPVDTLQVTPRHSHIFIIPSAVTKKNDDISADIEASTTSALQSKLVSVLPLEVESGNLSVHENQPGQDFIEPKPSKMQVITRRFEAWANDHPFNLGTVYSEDMELLINDLRTTHKGSIYDSVSYDRLSLKQRISVKDELDGEERISIPSQSIIMAIRFVYSSYLFLKGRDPIEIDFIRDIPSYQETMQAANLTRRYLDKLNSQLASGCRVSLAELLKMMIKQVTFA